MSANKIVERLLVGKPYELTRADKLRAILPALDFLTRHHYNNCIEYRRVVDAVFGGIKNEAYTSLEELPYLPVSLFKRFALKSIHQDNIYRILSSSGTTGQNVSRIYLDQETAGLQAKVLVKIMQYYLGKDRLPMVILDHGDVIKDRTTFSARGAGIRGLMQFGRNPIYALKSDMSLDWDLVERYISENLGKPVLFFGFTYMVWQYVIEVIRKTGRKLPKNKGVLIHSGGWKKLEERRVETGTFNSIAREVLGVERVLNFYGMVEQVGSVYFENSLGALQTPVFSDVIVRDPLTLRPLPAGEKGLIQVLSILPLSYPGHSLLTEDIGEWLGDDESAVGINGRYFKICGRAPRSEIRGCSDTYVQSN